MTLRSWGIVMRQCRLKNPAPSMRAASWVSCGRESSRARKSTNANPASRQTMTPIIAHRLTLGSPSQLAASTPRPSLPRISLSAPFCCSSWLNTTAMTGTGRM